MKKLISLLLVLSLLLCGCGGTGDEELSSDTSTEAPTTKETATKPTTEMPTEEPTEEPTEPVPEVTYINPLTGETLDAPLENRLFAVTINNVRAAVPHYGVSHADVFFEMFVNDYATRGLALFSDIAQVSDIGSVRSLRYNFTDIAQGYDAIMVYCGGSGQVISDLDKSGIDSIYAEVESGNYYYRDEVRRSAGYASEHCLFVKGPELKAFAESKNFSTTQSADKDYGMTFGEVSSAASGEAAATVNIRFSLDGNIKDSIMVYDETTGLYVYNQYKKEMTDPIYNQKEGFRNVIVVFANVTNKGVYHVANLVDSGNGYFACDGKIIPIQWYRESETDTFHFTLTDGTPLTQGVGSSYIALVPLKSTVSWE